MGFLSTAFDPSLVALNSDAASSAMFEANAASAAAATAAGKASDASSAVASRSAIWDKASAASSAAVVAQSKASDASSAAVVNAAAMLKKDGSVSLTSDWDIGDGRKIQADKVQARDGDGLYLVDDADNGIFVKDGGNVGIGVTDPDALLELYKVGSTQLKLSGGAADYATFEVSADGDLEITPVGGPELAPTSCCTDPDDDQDNTTGWTAANATLTSEAGGVTGYRLKVAATAANGQASKITSVTKGKLYRFKVKAGADVGDNYDIILYNYDDSSILYTTGSVAGQGAGIWDTIDIVVEATVNELNLFIMLRAVANTDNAYFDNVSLEEHREVSFDSDVKVDGTLIVAAGAADYATFEVSADGDLEIALVCGSNLVPTSCCTDPDDDQDNTTGWTAANATLTSEAGGVTGYRLKVAATGIEGRAYVINLLTSGKLYRLKAKAGADVGDQYRIAIGSATYGGFIYDTGVIAGTGAGNWDTIDTIISCPQTLANWILRLEATNITDNAYFDNVSLEEHREVSFDSDVKVDGTLIVTDIDINAVPSSNQTASGPQTNSINAGESITVMDCVYLKSDGEWWQTDANAVATAGGMIAISLESKTDGNAMNVALPGSFIRDDSWTWTVGGIIYLSGTLGALTQTAPSGTDDVIRIVGYATHADRMFFNPESTVVIHI